MMQTSADTTPNVTAHSPGLGFDLRERLAAARSILANERTFLA